MSSGGDDHHEEPLGIGLVEESDSADDQAEPPMIRELGEKPSGLLVALVLAPDTYSRNRYFDLFQQDDCKYARRRAQLVRSLVKDLTEPWPHAGARPSGPGPDRVEEVEHGEQIHLSYEVGERDYRRLAVLSRLEAAALHYALSLAGHGNVSDSDRRLVESALGRLDPLAQS